MAFPGIKKGRPSNADKAQELIREITDRYKVSVSAEDDNRRAQISDLNFTYDNTQGREGQSGQWESAILTKRKGRPNYTFNRTIGAVNQVIGDQRQNKPSIKVRGVDSEADPDTADVFTGLIRNIENVSDADTAYDTAFKFAAAGGYGCWLVEPEFETDLGFDQEIKIKRVANPMTWYVDPHATDFCKRDSRYWIGTERMPKEEFEAQYPGKATSSIHAMDRHDSRLWFTDEEVRIAIYYKKVPKKKILALLSDGRAVEYDKDIQSIEDELKPLGITVERFREVKSHIVRWVKVSGVDILEGPIDYNWRYIPVVPVYGRNINIEGKELLEGVVRHAKDAQRVYNYEMSTAVEVTAIQPKAPYMATPKMIKDHEEMYRTANVKNYPYLLYNIDPESPLAKPSREAPPDVPIAILSIAQAAAADIDATTGFKRQSGLEQQLLANDPSGRALIEQRRQGEAGDFEFMDNLAKAIKFTGQILVDMIPQVYDTERQLRIIGQDGKDEMVTVNTEVKDKDSGKMVKMHDLRQGRYDVAVDVGPSFMTQRQEAANMLIQLSGNSPIVAQVTPDLIVKNLDMTGADELEQRLRGVLIRQGVIQPTEEDKENIQQPDPQAQEMQQIVQRLGVMRLELENLEKRASIAKDEATAEETEVDTAVKLAEFIDGDADPKTRVSVS